MRILEYTRIVTGDDGGSRFVAAEMTLDAATVAPGTPPMLLAGMHSAGGVRYVRSDRFTTAAHSPPVRQWVVMLRGLVEITTTDGRRRRFGPGDLLLAADTDGLGHISAGIGDPPFEALYIPVDPAWREP